MHFISKLLSINSKEIKIQTLTTKRTDKPINTQDFNGFLEDKNIKEYCVVMQNRGSCPVKHIRGYNRRGSCQLLSKSQRSFEF